MALEKAIHRPGSLKQTNKAHKTGRHRSKGAIDNDQKGRVSVKTLSKKFKQMAKKEQRRSLANQLRKKKRQDTISQKRLLGCDSSAPFLVCLLPLNSKIDPESALVILRTCDPDATVTKTPTGLTHISIPRFKQRFSFIMAPIGPNSEIQALDCLKVCDTSVLLLSANAAEDEIYDRFGQRILNMAIAQGIPTPIVALMDLESINPRLRTQSKAAIQKLVNKAFPHEKLVTLDTDADGLNLLRKIGSQKRRPIHYQSHRPHMYGETINYIGSDSDPSTGTLQITGYLRGTPLNVNNLIYIPGLGDFQMSQIIDQTVNSPADPTKRPIEQSVHILAMADPMHQISLDRENIPDEMDGEQNFPTEEEIIQAQKETKAYRLVKRVPKGMGDYQASWLPDVEEIDCDDKNSGTAEDDDENSDSDSYMSCISEKSSDDEFEDVDDVEEEFDTVSVSDAPVNDAKYDLDLDLQEECETFTKIKAARTDQMWPDEIDTPLNVEARNRFQKYRGLESFRTSPWDVKENLPIDYAKIFQFKNFERIKRRMIKDSVDVEGIEPGKYITVCVTNVSSTIWQSWLSGQEGKHLIFYGLLPHEHKMCVINVMLKRSPGSTMPIKSKERLLVQCGYRRFMVNPIFSAHTNGNKHKYERYFRPNETVVASFYAPIQYPPAPVLCFQSNPDSSLRLVANGVLLSCTPDRIVLKRVILTGHPFKINKKTATIRYMFYNKEDIEYFRPIKLRTKCGRLGHIKESLGTHGHMKCVFDNMLKSFDSVFLYLYKRIFPKWNYEECLGDTYNFTISRTNDSLQDIEMS